MGFWHTQPRNKYNGVYLSLTSLIHATAQEVLRVLVATLDADTCVPAQTCAAAALWCLASTSAVRTRMLSVHAVQALLRMLMRCSLPTFGTIMQQQPKEFLPVCEFETRRDA